MLLKNNASFIHAVLMNNATWKKKETFKLAEKGVLEVFGSNIYHIGRLGLRILNDGKFQNTSLSVSSSAIYMPDFSNAFVQIFEKDKCLWHHYLTNSHSPQSLTGTGLTVQCGQYNGFFSDNTRITLTSFLGNKITTRNLTMTAVK